MERECCLSLLIALIGGAALLACGWWPAAEISVESARQLERIMWRRIWLPTLPALALAAALCGWAMVEPDPVPEKVPVSLIVVSLLFVMLFARSLLRSLESLISDRGDPGTATVGFVRSWIVFPPHLAKKLNDRQIEAALEHERAHARHLDPLRIWLAQLATDLQWPWPQARERMHRWMAALELARDEEARAAGIDGTDLAEAIVASARFGQTVGPTAAAALTGPPEALRRRVERLLDPLPADSQARQNRARNLLFVLLPCLVLALALGCVFGEQAVRGLFWLAA